MKYSFEEIILCSQDASRMMDFLSDVCEFEVDLKREIVKGGELSFKLKHSPETAICLGPSFRFSVDSSDELEELKGKFDFFVYRKGLRENESAFFKAIDDETKELVITDLDQRMWVFSLS